MIHPLDSIISGGYILAIFGIGLWTGLRHQQRTKDDGAGGYFLASKSLRWPMIGLALFASNISCVHLVSLAQSGFDTGLLNGNFEWMASLVLILLALFFAPYYIRSGVTTLPDFLEQRYDRASRDWLTGVSIASAIIVHISFSLLAGGIVLETLFAVDMYTGVIAISVITAIYTIVGGLSAVVVTESIQTVVLVLGALIISGAAYAQMGGWQEMEAVLRQTNQLEKLSMMRPAGDGSGMPWYAVFLGYPVLGIWYWCADQTIVQRVLGAKDEYHARMGPLFCGFIKILPVFIFVLPGLFAHTLAQTGRLDLSALKNPASGEIHSKGIYTLMITQLLPTGLVGILVAALLSGLMSQISGALNSISTLVSYDLYQRYRPDTTDRQLIRVGKISAGLALLVSLLILPLLNRYESIFNGLNDIIAHLAPPITCVFLLGIFWKKASAISAKITLWFGSVLGVAVFIVAKVAPQSIIGNVPFLMVAFYLFCFCVMLQVVLSKAFPDAAPSRLQLLHWKTTADLPAARSSYQWLSLLLGCIMGLLFWWFR